MIIISIILWYNRKEANGNHQLRNAVRSNTLTAVLSEHDTCRAERLTRNAAHGVAYLFCILFLSFFGADIHVF